MAITWRLGGWAMFVLLVVRFVRKADSVLPPQNFSIAYLASTEITLIWTVLESDDIDGFQLTYDVIEESHHKCSITHYIPKKFRSFTLYGLVPLRTYRSRIFSMGSYGITNSSNDVEFTTTDGNVMELHLVRQFHPEEAVIVAIVVVVWFIAVIIFLRRWGSIRISQPFETRYQHKPKNLENVTVVKRPQDSVIYKNYNRKMSVTLIEREKRRLERMNTMPTIEMESVITEA